MARTPLGFLLWYVCENEIWNSNKFQNPDVTVARWRIVLDLNTCIEVSCREFVYPIWFCILLVSECFYKITQGRS